MRVRLRVPVGSGRRVGVGPTAALRAAAAASEPGSTLVAAALHADSRRPLVLTVEDRSGTVAGAVVLERRGPSQWDALTLVVDPGAAALLARLVDRSPASVLVGVGPHVAPVAGHLRRARSSARSPFYGAVDANATPPADLDRRSRAATAADLPALVDLFATSYRLGRPPDRASWRRSLQQVLLDGLAVVAEVDGRVVGATLCGAVSAAWAFGTDAVIRPDQRGQGLSWAMANRLFALATVHGLAICGAAVDDNPMDPEHHHEGHGSLADELWGVALEPHLAWPSVRWRRRQARRVHRSAEALGAAARRRWRDGALDGAPAL